MTRRLITYSGYGFFIVWLVLMLSTLFTYEGSKIYYGVFSLIFLYLLLQALFSPLNFSYLFLSIMMWLGFWAKFTYHSLLHFPYQEAVGNFVATPAANDHILLVASIGGLGILLARYGYQCWFGHEGLQLPLQDLSIVPRWYRRYRSTCLLAFILSMLGVFALNFYLGIFMVGIAPQTILMWPLNAMISWALSIGYALMVSTMLWWEIHLKRDLQTGYLAQLLESALMSVAILSRAIYIFHVVPAALTWYVHRHAAKPLERKKIIQLLFLSVVLFFASLQMVSVLRVYYYEGLSWSAVEVRSPLFVKIFSQLVLDRWLGVEGVMAASASEMKGWYTFKQALLEKAEIGKTGIYQTIARSHYSNIDNKRFIFGTLPGLIGFLYISGSLFCVIIGAFFFTFVMMLAERTVRLLTHNPFLCALFAMTIANTVAQFGVAPRMVIKQYLLIYIYIGIIALLQRGFLYPRWLGARWLPERGL